MVAGTCAPATERLHLITVVRVQRHTRLLFTPHHHRWRLWSKIFLKSCLMQRLSTSPCMPHSLRFCSTSSDHEMRPYRPTRRSLIASSEALNGRARAIVTCVEGSIRYCCFATHFTSCLKKIVYPARTFTDVATRRIPGLATRPQGATSGRQRTQAPPFLSA